MHAQRLALYLAPRSLLYFRHVIGHMPADAVDIFVPDDLVRNGGDDCQPFGNLRTRATASCPWGRREGATARWALQASRIWNAARPWPRFPPGASCCCTPRPSSSCRTIRPSPMCSASTRSRSIWEAAGGAAGRRSRTGDLPRGDLSARPWEDRRQLPRERLRRLLEEHLDAPVPADRGLILYCGGLLDQPREHVDAVRQLAVSRTVLFKPFYDHPIYEALDGVDGVHLIRDSVHVSPNAMRFAADTILTSPLSGVFTTSLLLRQHVMPFLTWHQSAARDHNAFAPWKARLPPADALPELHIARKLGGPFDNKTLHAMQKNMDNPHYWQRYDAAQEGAPARLFWRLSH